MTTLADVLEAERKRLLDEAVEGYERCNLRSQVAGQWWARWLWARQARRWARIIDKAMMA